MKNNAVLLRTAIAVLILTTATGCKSYMKFRYGLTQPGEETPEGLLAFLEKNKYPVSRMYMFNDSSSYLEMMRNKVFQHHCLSHMNFDRAGRLIAYDTTACQWAGNRLIAALHPDSSYRTFPGLTLGEVLPLIRPFGKPFPGDTILTPDFTVIVAWAKYIGKYNYRLFGLAGAIDSNKMARIRVIWLNTDMQKSWHLAKGQRIEIQ